MAAYTAGTGFPHADPRGLWPLLEPHEHYVKSAGSKSRPLCGTFSYLNKGKSAHRRVDPGCGAVRGGIGGCQIVLRNARDHRVVHKTADIQLVGLSPLP